MVPKEKGVAVKVDGIIIKPLQNKATDVRVVAKTPTKEIDVFFVSLSYFAAHLLFALWNYISSFDKL